MIFKFIIFSLFISITSSYILPQIYREFHPIGIYSSINKNNIYPFNIGPIPFLLWFPFNNNPISIINTCKHLGNNLKDSSLNLNKSCLICPFHNISHDINDNFGTTIIKNNIIWWSFKSFHKNPPFIKYNNNNDIKTFDINIDFISFILNFLSFYFNSSNNNYSYLIKNKNHIKRLFIKYNDNSKRILFIYPYTFFISNNKEKSHLISLFPTNSYNTKLYINNYYSYYYNSFKELFEKKTNTFKFKNLFILKSSNNNYLEKINKFYNDNYYDINNEYKTTLNFMKNYKYY